ncbi:MULTISPECIES: DUF362 domain-containing protein [unclassified Candidatus Frackibacter]|uniref:DUF362 domain-containing protein n=1 Tax=unclassified Candidatus Frackibacter TaxID=2648818 RepID=UPI000794D9A2|nr:MULTISPECIES: DUF362 domain-containing protein [unclassified Candidatus Frackibacter]KXS42639.1 MAG: hypothetical protein AWU54_1268 [Candidatus Frackibacter sp. T328-2]SDC72371.1 Uncharacterized conserved protein, DUF362 family [Candidatus Frackibacter sp. WG11]SEM86648.1 Uncharacterized conserved protein, DUF362 family [Candidatus Frackibacter sp. WG12]SFL95700.1 Uncharacterized conserved protein, DUF362 family [Candidatus Frackibacter sp. WG13]
MSTVASISCSKYEEELVIKAVKRAVSELGGLSQWIDEGDRVLIKPNLLSPKAPEQAVTTHPLVLKATIQLVKEVGAIPIVGESSGGFLAEESLTAKAFDKTGTQTVCEEMNVEMINFDRVETEVVANSGSTVAEFNLPLPVLDADFIISLPKMKTHSLTLFTGAVKNLYGVIPGLKKMEYHRQFPNPNNFAEVIVDIFATVGADLAIMDGIIGLAGDGPGSSGVPCAVGTILASDDLVALDTVAANYLGYKDKQVQILNLAAKRGLGKASLRMIEIKGDFEQPDYRRYDLPSNAFLSHLPNFLLKPFLELMMSKPIINQKNCTHCRTCLKSCPQLVIEEIDQGEDYHLEIDQEGCIKCLCCQEVCPYDAVDLKEHLLIKLIRQLS